MTIYVGFSTQNIDEVRKQQINSGGDGGSGSVTNPVRVNKKFRLTDRDLVIRDLLNAFNIPQGQKPGNPSYGTTLWRYVFEPNTFDVRAQIEQELRRLIAQDPRLILNTLSVYPYENGVQIELELAINPFNQVERMSFLFDQNVGRASLLY